MLDMDDLKKRKMELETTLESLHKLIKCRNAVLSSIERLSFHRVITHQRSLLNMSSKGDKKNFMAISSRAIEVDAKMNRRCLFHLRAKEKHLEELLNEVILKLSESESSVAENATPSSENLNSESDETKVAS
ncbi:hypothetical protein [Fluviispira sanaruensis]|uniref:Uncharacterized protein n=1 Tax=Fluviispira sanaruensis TaxID=2493639 RepID=A0A4P2VLM1_FLUSA|nr:hypothetical protein [Fluviispira sanaruensis]BBH53771.1 hypothetical protein JCM31447_22190 [Fluviispira sanaruensis]